MGIGNEMNISLLKKISFENIILCNYLLEYIVKIFKRKHNIKKIKFKRK